MTDSLVLECGNMAIMASNKRHLPCPPLATKHAEATCVRRACPATASSVARLESHQLPSSPLCDGRSTRSLQLKSSQAKSSEPPSQVKSSQVHLQVKSSQVTSKSSRAKSSQVKPSQAKSSQVKPSQAKSPPSQVKASPLYGASPQDRRQAMSARRPARSIDRSMGCTLRHALYSVSSGCGRARLSVAVADVTLRMRTVHSLTLSRLRIVCTQTTASPSAKSPIFLPSAKATRTCAP